MTKNTSLKKINKALISVYHKDNILEIAEELIKNECEIFSTGGTYDYLKENNIPVTTVESLTGYPSIFGGRVKTLHPKVFGGILYRRDDAGDVVESNSYDIPAIDLVIVDLYPFEEYIAAKAEHHQIIEKIDIGGISLIRAAAKNYKDVVIVPSKEQYPMLLDTIRAKDGCTSLEDRELFAAYAFLCSSHYDSEIFAYFNQKANIKTFSKVTNQARALRYGENPHQEANYFGGEQSLPIQLHGKELSYNNMLDLEAALELIADFEDCAVAILKHNNTCGCAIRANVLEAWNAALAADPVSAFGGIIVTNRCIDLDAANEINKIFFELIIAPDYTEEALNVLKSKKNRIILKNAQEALTAKKFRSLLSGVLVQDRDSYKETSEDLNNVSKRKLNKTQTKDLLFANILVKHSKSNAIVLAKDNTLIASGIGQTSRVDALRQAIEKAKGFNLSLEGSVMASDAFFPFADCVEIAHKAGIEAVIHPGGSMRDQDSIDFCDANNMAMAITGKRHFKH